MTTQVEIEAAAKAIHENNVNWEGKGIEDFCKVLAKAALEAAARVRETPTLNKEVSLWEAIEQALDDMGDGLCLSEETKDTLVRAITITWSEPALPPSPPESKP